VARRSSLLRTEKERVKRADGWDGGVSEPVATSRARDALGEGFERPALVQVVPLHHHSVAHPRGGGFDCLRSRALCCVRCTRLRHLAQRRAHPALKAGCTVAFSSQEPAPRGCQPLPCRPHRLRRYPPHWMISTSPVATAVSPDPSATVTFRGGSSAGAERAHLPTRVALISSSPSVRACCTAPGEQSGQARGQSVVCEEAHEIASNRKENDFLLSHTTDHPVRRALVTR
jgi:hypothetical protein